MSVEMTVFVVPALILLVMFVVFCGRSASAAIDVRSAAAAAARAAADAPTPAQARTAVTTTLATTDATRRWRCSPDLDTTALHLGGQVTVAITCRIPLSDLGFFAGGTRRSVHASATEPIDTFRAYP